MKQDMQQMHELDQVLQWVLDEKNHDNLEPADQVYDGIERPSQTDGSVKTATEDKLETETMEDEDLSFMNEGNSPDRLAKNLGD